MGRTALRPDAYGFRLVPQVSADHNSNTYNYKHTFSTEIVPICKEDLVRADMGADGLFCASAAEHCSDASRCLPLLQVCLPHKVFSALGGIGPIMLCIRVSNILTLVVRAQDTLCSVGTLHELNRPGHGGETRLPSENHRRTRRL